MAFSNHDVKPDTPINNFATLNPLDQSGGTLSEGNLDFLGTGSGYTGATGTLGVNSGKWYYEICFEGNTTASGNTGGTSINYGWILNDSNKPSGMTGSLGQTGADSNWENAFVICQSNTCLLYTSPSPRDS